MKALVGVQIEPPGQRASGPRCAEKGDLVTLGHGAAATPPALATADDCLHNEALADRNWELGAKWADSNITVPTAFIAGSFDPVLKMIRPDAIDIMRSHTPDLRQVTIIPDAGHFVQHDAEALVNRTVKDWLDARK